MADLLVNVSASMQRLSERNSFVAVGQRRDSCALAFAAQHHNRTPKSQLGMIYVAVRFIHGHFLEADSLSSHPGNYLETIGAAKKCFVNSFPAIRATQFARMFESTTVLCQKNCNLCRRSTFSFSSAGLPSASGTVQLVLTATTGIGANVLLPVPFALAQR
jgi:hypothetical protein